MIQTKYRLDLLIEDLIIVELKSVTQISDVDKAQILSHMKLMKKPKGLLINFHCMNIFREGQQSFVNDLYSRLPDH